jgi:hypothetical protein
MILLYAVFATIDPRRNSATDLGPLAIGGAVTICHLVAVPVTGCGINPARSIGPALFGAQEGRDDLWLFILAPLCASALVAFTYPYFFAEESFVVGGLRARFMAKKQTARSRGFSILGSMQNFGSMQSLPVTVAP